jgi:hypothetical protein
MLISQVLPPDRVDAAIQAQQEIEKAVTAIAALRPLTPDVDDQHLGCQQGDVRPDADLPGHMPPRNLVIDAAEEMWRASGLLHGCREKTEAPQV